MTKSYVILYISFIIESQQDALYTQTTISLRFKSLCAIIIKKFSRQERKKMIQSFPFVDEWFLSSFYIIILLVFLVCCSSSLLSVKTLAILWL